MADVPAPTRAELVEALRSDLFEEVVRVADLSRSLCVSIGEAAYRGDQTTMTVHLRQLRACVLEMIDTQKTLQRAERPRDQNLAEKGNGAGRGDDQRAGDGVTRS